MGRHKNRNWNLPDGDKGNIRAWDYVPIAVLMDIRDELQTLNAVFACYNFQSIPRELRSIKRELATMRKERAK